MSRRANPEALTPLLVLSLAHWRRWIGLSEAELRKINLGGAKDRLQEFNAKRKLKAAAKTVMAVNKMQKAVMAFK